LKFNPILLATEAEAAFAGKFTTLVAFPENEGGQGIVFKANANSCSPTQQLLALKIYYPGSLTERTKREVEALRRLHCETFVKLFDAGHVVLRGQQCMYVAMEFIDGEVLSNILARGPLTPNRAARIACDIALAIQALWQERIVHRDIKPQNIMLTNVGRAVLIDLGIAKHLSLGSLTTAGKTWGTEGYMSPEHAKALRQLSCKSDVFALGIVLQESLAGSHPTGFNQMALLSGGLPTTGLGLNLPVNFMTSLDLLLHFNPHRRPTPEQVLILFNQYL
jgi:eukaryotic-like serine/threonine-protein kinase